MDATEHALHMDQTCLVNALHCFGNVIDAGCIVSMLAG